MRAFNVLLGLIGAASARYSPGTIDASDKPLVVVYLPNWAVWQQLYRPWDFEQGVLSRQMPVRNWVVNLAFTTLSAKDCRIGALDQEADFTKYDDRNRFFTGTEQWFQPGAPYAAGSWPMVIAMKHQKYPYIKLIPSLGGWSASHSYTGCVSDPNLRKNAVESIVDVVSYFGFDGIDFDWEYPECPGDSPTTGTCGCQHEPTCPHSSNAGQKGDWENYKSLIMEVREAFNAAEDKLGRRLYITAAMGMSPTFLDGDSPFTAPVPIEWICDNDYFDWVNLMTYDYYGPFAAKTGHLAPLYKSSDPDADPKDKQMSVDDSVQRWVKKCSRPEKLMLGLATYGKAWATVPNTGKIPGLFQTSQNTHTDTITANMTYGPWATWEQGTVTGWDIEKTYLPTCQRYFDEESKSPVIYCEKDPKPENQNIAGWSTNTFITYEDAESWKYKMQYARKNGLGGAIIWSASDFGSEAAGIDITPKLFQGLFDGWYGEGKVTVSTNKGLNGASKFAGPPDTSSQYLFPCPYGHTWDNGQSGGSERDPYADWKSFDPPRNPCYPHDFSNARYPVMEGTMTKDEIGKDVILISAGTQPEPSPETTESNNDNDDTWPAGCPTPHGHKKTTTHAPKPKPVPTDAPAPTEEPTDAPAPTVAPIPTNAPTKHDDNGSGISGDEAKKQCQKGPFNPIYEDGCKDNCAAWSDPAQAAHCATFTTLYDCIIGTMTYCAP